MGPGYTSPCGCNIAERVRPGGEGEQWGRIVPRGMASQHGRYMHVKMTMGVSLCHCVHSCWHVSQILVFIYADGAVLTAAAKVMLVTSQNAFELKCWGGATLEGMRNLSATNGSLCISTRAATGWGTHLSPPRIPEDASFTKLGPPTTLDPDCTYLRPLLRPALPSCVPCFPGPLARGPAS